MPDDEENDILTTNLPEGETCDICGLNADIDYDNVKYCEDCYETEILHQWYNFFKKSLRNEAFYFISFTIHLFKKSFSLVIFHISGIVYHIHLTKSWLCEYSKYALMANGI